MTNEEYQQAQQAHEHAVVDSHKNPAAVALGRKGGLAAARNRKWTYEQRANFGCRMAISRVLAGDKPTPEELAEVGRRLAAARKAKREAIPAA